MKYSKESELCADFMELAQEHGWTAYPETSNWDILLVKKGVQIGIEAKLRANFEVLNQAMPRILIKDRTSWGPGPHYRAVLVPKASKAFGQVCRNLHLYCFRMEDYFHGGHRLKNYFWTPNESSDWFLWESKERCWTPDYIPNVEAGVPSPVSLTQWKQKALELTALAEAKGYVTSKDAKALKIGFKNFSTLFLEKTGEKEGRCDKWRLREKCRGKSPRDQHPQIYEKILEKTKSQLNADT
jgi:hypothetical protein